MDPVYHVAVWFLRFSAIINAIILYTTVAVASIPPDVEKTNEKNEPGSISLTHFSYVLFFSSSFCQ